jgi:uncharacterized repeat protein (TIGR02543 family)
MDRGQMNKRISLTLIVAILSIALSAPLLVGTVNAIYIFSDDFESGNLNQWSVTYGTLSTSTQISVSGSHSVESRMVGPGITPGQNMNLYYKTLDSVPNPLYVREYVYINSTSSPSTNGDYYQVGGFSSSQGGNFGAGEICVFNVANTLYWGVYYRSANSSLGFDFSISTSNSTLNATPVSIGWNCVELKQSIGTLGIYGKEQLFVNGISILDVSVDNYQRTPANVVIGGYESVTNSNDRWNYYIDDVAVSSSYIGPISYNLAIISPYGTKIGEGMFAPGVSAYAAVTPLTVDGTPGVRYVFTGWSGDASGVTSPSDAIIMHSDKIATANWKTQYYLNVTSVNGTVGGSGWYDSGTNATATLNSLTVAGAIGTQYIFTNWSGSASGTNSTSNNITMNGPKTATANWQTQYNITLAQSGIDSDFSGNVVTVNGTSYDRTGFSTWANSSDVYTFSYGSQLVVAANSKQLILTGVSGNSSALSVIASQPTTITGLYKTQYYFTSTSSYSSLSPSNGWYDSGSSINAFVASPVSGITGTQYVCTGWSGTGSVTASGTASAMSFAINAPSSITWNWKTQYLISFVVSPSGDGTTSPSGTNSWQDSGSISISGTPSYDYKFSSWSADTASITFGNSNTGSTTATISGPGNITANFVTLPAATPTPTPVPTPRPSTSPSPSPTVSPSPSPTAAPSPSPTRSTSGSNINAAYLYGSIIAIVVVAILVTLIFLMRRKTK